jgi:3-oxoadipate enol-lactonase
MLLIVGTKDATVPGIKAINQAVPGSKVVELEGAGHLSNLEQPDKFSKAIRDFIKPA